AAIGTVALLLVTSVILLSAALGREREARRQAVRDKEKAQQVMKFVVQLADNSDGVMNTLHHLDGIVEADGKVAEAEKMRTEKLDLLQKPGQKDLLSSDQLGSILVMKASIEARHGQW